MHSTILHKVYYLDHPVTGELLYIGRSLNPRQRRRAFESRTGIKAVLDLCQRFTDFEAAQRAEVQAILRHRPPFNKIAVSGRGTLGHAMAEETRTKLSHAHMGKVLSDEHKANIGAYQAGKPKSTTHREHIRAALTGVPFTEERKANISRSLKGKLKGRRQSPEHLAKRIAALRRFYAKA